MSAAREPWIFRARYRTRCQGRPWEAQGIECACAGWTCGGGAKELWSGGREESHEETRIGLVFGGDAGGGGGGAGAETRDSAGAANGWWAAADAGAEGQEEHAGIRRGETAGAGPGEFVVGGIWGEPAGREKDGAFGHELARD